MEFFEAPAFARYLPEYLDDEGYRRLQQELARKPEAGELIPGREDFGKFAGPMFGVAKGGEGGCE